MGNFLSQNPEFGSYVGMAKNYDFTSLIFYQKAIVLAKELYPKTLHFPAHERFNLGDQIRRALTSITGNIAEGYGRYTFKDRKRFFVISRGSVCELMSHLTLCTIAEVMTIDEAERFKSQCQCIRFLINRYLRWLQKSAAANRSSRRPPRN